MEQLYDELIEKTVIGSLIGNAKAYEETSDLLQDDCFYVTEYKRLYSCVSAIVRDGNEPDIMTVHRLMKQKGYQLEVWQMADICSNRAMNISQYAAILHDLMVKRKLVTLAEEIKAKVYDFQSDPNDIISYVSQKTSSFYRGDEGGIHNLVETLTELQETVDANYAGGDGKITGTRTGLGKLDEASGGFHPTDLIVIAAESSVGKTAIAINIAVNAAQCGEPVAIYSMEMTRQQIAARMVSAESGVASSTILYKKLTDTQLEMYDKGIGRLTNCKMYFDDRSTSNIDSIISSIRFLVRKHGVRGAVVDYLQLISINSVRGMREEQQLAEYARRLKNVAKELNIWIVAISQLSRDNMNHEPNDNRLRGSGQIKEAADVVMLIYRPEIYGGNLRYPEPYQDVSTKGTALVKISKGRNIGMMQFIVGFDAARTKFYDLDDLPTDAPPPMPDDVPERIRKQISEQEDLPF